MSGVPTKDKNGNRISLVTQQTMVGVKDPSDHARRQVKELDKTAKKSKDKRKATLEQIEADKKEIAQIDKRLAEIHREYDPLVKALEEKLEKKKHLQAMLEQCKKTQKEMMGSMKTMVNENMVRSYKQNARDATFKLETLRGYNLKPESTFKQKGRR